MRVVFMGTPAFAAEALRAICEEGGHDVVLVVTNPDKPSGGILRISGGSIFP